MYAAIGGRGSMQTANARVTSYIIAYGAVRANLYGGCRQSYRAVLMLVDLKAIKSFSAMLYIRIYYVRR